MRCPCLSGNIYDECCGPIHAGAHAPTAERLMRSRFTAFARGDEEYLLRSWHPRTRPTALELDTDTRWYRLDIHHITGGGPFDREGTVTFEAYFRTPTERGSQCERSTFERTANDWFYVDGETLPPSQ